MSKSVGNIFLNRDFIAKHGAETLKFLLLAGHYRSPIDFSERHIRESQAALHRVYTTLGKCQSLAKLADLPHGPLSSAENALTAMGKGFEARWVGAMDDDFNTAKIIGFVFEYVRALNGYLDKKGFKPNANSVVVARQFLEVVGKLSGILNLFALDSTVFLTGLKERMLADKNLSAHAIEAQISERKQARDHKDFARADGIRKALLEQGIELQDSPTGTLWDIVFVETAV